MRITFQNIKMRARSGSPGGAAAGPAGDVGGGSICLIVCSSAQTKNESIYVYIVIHLSSDSKSGKNETSVKDEPRRAISQNEESNQRVKRRKDYLG